MELRKDYALDRWVIISTERKNRPMEVKSAAPHDGSTCIFCVGSENKTPGEKGRLAEGNSWKFRWFPNKFPAARPEGNPNIETPHEFFSRAASFGYHEVIVETPTHSKQTWDFPQQDLKLLFKLFRDRINEISTDEFIKYVAVFKNQGKEAGASISHAHSQVMGINFIPKAVQEESAACQPECAYCKIIEIEKVNERKCFENDSFIAFSPYASRYPYELWVFPKRHLKNFNDFSENDFSNLASIMQQILVKLKFLNAPYNYYIHYAPKGSNLHFHVEILPRLSTWAGFEYCTETIINTVSPESAANFYRGEEVDEMDTCHICRNQFLNSPDDLVLCEFKEGFVHMGCCTGLCS